MLKRYFDILSSLFGLILLEPALIVVGILIRREDGGQRSDVGDRK
jgi:lipopolysaccharide/colanic/teichoic acid biosynthesis glycosyltransferase